MEDTVRTWVEVDGEALRHNLAWVRRQIGPGRGILAVVKANAYGHGGRLVARALAHDTAVFGVANVSEAIELGDAAGGRDIMLLSPCFPAERRVAVERGFIATVSSAGEAAAFAEFGPVRVNFKIDTGMGRAGCDVPGAGAEMARLAGLAKVRVHSISTHLPCADGDPVFTRHQLEVFQQISASARQFFPGVLRHSLNSAGILLGGFDQADLVRPGLLLYGVSPSPDSHPPLRPALTWKARVVLTRVLPAGSSVSYGRDFTTSSELPTAIVSVGYADGFPRHLSGRGACVLIRGVRCPVLGRVTMDQIVVDTRGVPGVECGDVAVLIGQDGKECLTANEMADRAGTISWDILTGLGRRVAHVPSSGCGMAFASMTPP